MGCAHCPRVIDTQSMKAEARHLPVVQYTLDPDCDRHSTASSSPATARCCGRNDRHHSCSMDSTPASHCIHTALLHSRCGSPPCAQKMTQCAAPIAPMSQEC